MKLVIEINLDDNPIADNLPASLGAVLMEAAVDLYTADTKGRDLVEMHGTTTPLLDEWGAGDSYHEAAVWLRMKTVDEPFDPVRQNLKPARTIQCMPDGERREVPDGERRGH